MSSKKKLFFNIFHNYNITVKLLSRFTYLYLEVNHTYEI